MKDFEVGDRVTFKGVYATVTSLLKGNAGLLAVKLDGDYEPQLADTDVWKHVDAVTKLAEIVDDSP